MIDSELRVNEKPDEEPRSGSESLTQIAGKLSFMPSNRDTVLTDFVRHKIQEWLTSGREQKELARLAGLKSPSSVSMIKSRLGVGAKTAPGFAKAFGYASVDALVDAAYDWRKASGEDLDALLAEEPVRAAMDQVVLLVPGTTEESLKAILSAFTAPRFRGRDQMYWLETLGKEAQRDAMAIVMLSAEQRAQRREKKSRAKQAEQHRGMWREAGSLKRQISEPRETPPSAEPAATSPKRTSARGR